MPRIDRISQGDQVVYKGYLYVMYSHIKKHSPTKEAIIMLKAMDSENMVGVPFSEKNTIYKYDHYTQLKRQYRIEKRVDKNVWRIMERIGERWDHTLPSTVTKLGIKSRYYSHQIALEAQARCREYEDDRYEDSTYKWEVVE